MKSCEDVSSLKNRGCRKKRIGLKTHYDPEDGTGREVGGGFRMGNMCTPVADSC